MPKLPRKEQHRDYYCVIHNEGSLARLIAYRLRLTGNSFKSCYRWVYKRFKIVDHPTSINQMQYDKLTTKCEEVLQSLSELSRSKIKQLFRIEMDNWKTEQNYIKREDNTCKLL